MQNIYVQVLIQWVFFFGIMSIILFPAFVFRKIALANNKNGWWFFLLGIGIGFVALEISRLIPLALSANKISSELQIVVVIAMIVVGHLIDIVAVRFFRMRVSK